MKIIHTSDVHIDSPLTSRLSPDKVKERRAELRSAWRRLIDEAERASADAVIIAGDLFDEGRISPRTAKYALDAISAARGITFFYLEGNHEGSALRDTGLDIPENLCFFGDEWTYYRLGDVTVAGRGGVSEGIFDTLELPDDRKHIVVLHGELRDSRCAEDIIGLRDTLGKGIDYLALGHYHSFSETALPDGGVAVYCGTPEGRGFDEVGECGYVLIDTEGGEIGYRFIPFAKRRLHECEVDITGAESAGAIEERAEAALLGIPAADLVRICLVGGYRPELIKDTEGLIRRFSGRFYYLDVKDCSRPIIDPEDYKYDKTLKGEFIRAVMADTELSDDMKARIISCGINALLGEELFGE